MSLPIGLAAECGFRFARGLLTEARRRCRGRASIPLTVIAVPGCTVREG